MPRCALYMMGYPTLGDSYATIDIRRRWCMMDASVGREARKD